MRVTSTDCRKVIFHIPLTLDCVLSHSFQLGLRLPPDRLLTSWLHLASLFTHHVLVLCPGAFALNKSLDDVYASISLPIGPVWPEKATEPVALGALHSAGPEGITQP
jgi:hypothetical protein